jgi:lipopolysaccharide export system protein LptA
MTRAAFRLARASLGMATIAATLLVVATQGLAQSERKASTAPRQQRNEPIRIASLSLEVRDRSKMATFSGDVRIRQGEFDLSSDTLVVFYDDQQRNVAGVTEVAATGDRPQIRRMEARGSVVVTQKHQRAASDRADFDMLSNMVTLSGNVVVTRCNNMLRGQRLIIDMTTGVSRMEGPVDGLLNSRSGDGGC